MKGGGFFFLLLATNPTACTQQQNALPNPSSLSGKITLIRLYFATTDALKTASSYFQIRHNHLRRSTAGLSFDFVFWSSAASILKISHIALLRWNTLARSQYADRYPLNPIPNDSLVVQGGPAPGLPGASLAELTLYTHTLLCVGLVVGVYQIHTIYKKTQTLSQGISTWTWGFSCLAVLIGTILYVNVLTGKYHTKFLDYVYYLYAVGELAEWLKYVPQISVNFMCRSTAGVSVEFLYTEALSAVALMCCLIHREHSFEPNSLFLLAVFKGLFVSKLLYQHYFEYRYQRVRSRRRYEKMLPTKE